MNTKKTTRHEMARLKKQMTDFQREEWSAQVVEQIEHTVCFRQARTVMMYYPLPDELDLRQLLQKWCTIKQIVLPVVVENDIRLKLYQGQEFMRQGAFGIFEPDTNQWFTSFEAIDLVLVPGIAFGADGSRLGRGKGYYDRFLPCVPQAWKIGVGFPFQLMTSVPTEPNDVYMDQIIVGCPRSQTLG